MIYDIDIYIHIDVSGSTVFSLRLLNTTTINNIPILFIINNISYTQYGGLRPFGVAFLYAGYDKHFGFQLYHSDPSGNYAGKQMDE